VNAAEAVFVRPPLYLFRTGRVYEFRPTRAEFMAIRAQLPALWRRSLRFRLELPAALAH
jgi:hypothetical protein